jgi:DNA-binding NtrC family response regulator
MSTVLIVDDEMLIRWAVAESLSAVGFDVLVAGSAAEALDHVARRVADIAVALLDLKLPDSHDFALLRRIRTLAPRCQIILMTADGRPGILAEAVQAGAFCAVAKPFDMHHMAGLVRQAAAA